MMLKLYQRGALLMAAIVLVVIILVMVTAMSFLSVSNIGASGSHMSSAQAFYIANSGLERALYQFSKNDIDCGSLADNKTVGSGSYTATGTVYPLAGTASTLSSAITAASTIIPITVSAGVYTNYAPHGRILIESEEIDYSSVSNSASVCGTAPCFVAEARGTNGTAAAAHGNGVKVFQPTQCLIRSTGTAGAATRVLEAVVREMSVQTGTTSFAASPTLTVSSPTFKPVNPNRAFVVCQNQQGDSHSGSRLSCELTDSGTLTFTQGTNISGETLRWYVVEFISGVTVQRGLNGLAVGTGTVNVPISAVNLANTFVIKSERVNNNNQNDDERWTTTAQLTTASNLQLVRNLSTTDIVSDAWQVIQHNSAAVQRNAALLTIGTAALAASNPIALSPAVDLTKTFAVGTFRAGSGVVGEERRYQTTTEFSDTTHLTFTRAFQNAASAGTQVDIFWYAVAMSDGTTVQRCAACPTYASSVNTANIAISSIVPGRSLPILSVRAVSSITTPTGDLDDMSWTAAFTSASNLQLVRANASTSATIAWFVVQFAPQISLVDRREIFP